MKRYFILQLKRMATCIPYMLVHLLLITAGMGCVIGLLLKKNADAADMQKIPIGIAGNLSEDYFNIAFTALEKMDSTSHTLQMQRMSEEEAAKALQEGTITAYAVIPDGFVQSVFVGQNKQIVFVTANASYDWGNQIIEELTEVISRLLVETQNAIYGMQHLAEAKEAEYDQRDAVEKLNLRYVELVLTRPDLFEIEYLSEGHPMSLKTYYGCALFVAILSFWGMGCVTFAVKRELSLTKLLRARGHHIFVLVFGEYFAYLVWLLGGACVVLCFCRFSGMLSGNVFSLLFAGIPVMTALAAVQFLLYELTGNVISAVLWQFITAVVCCYLSGCFYPIAFFPESVQRLAVYLPQGAALQYMLAYQNKAECAREFFVLVVYSVGCLGLTAALRAGRVEGRSR